MTVKLLMTWDIQSGKEQEYFEFVAGEFIPGLQRLGLETSDAWFTVYGNQPQIMAGAKSTDYNEMEEILDSLSERERKVLEMRFGLLDGQGHTLEEVGQEFGVTRERIRQIEAKALRKLRHPIRSRKLRDYLG